MAKIYDKALDESPPHPSATSSPLRSKPTQETHAGRRSLQPQPSTSAESASGERADDSLLMPPPPVPPPQRAPNIKRLSSRDVITYFATKSILSSATDVTDIPSVLDAPKYVKIDYVPAISALKTVEQQLKRSDDYMPRINSITSRVIFHLQDVPTPLSFAGAFEKARNAYIRGMQIIIDYDNRDMVNPFYNWEDVMLMMLLNGSVAKDVLKLPGQANIYSSLIDWCVYLFKNWHINLWIENKGGWDAVVRDKKAGTLLDLVPVIFHPARSPSLSLPQSPTAGTSTT